MSDTAALAVYAAVKYLAYTAWCWSGLHWIAAGRATWPAALTYGALRWLLGLGFGVAAAVALGSVAPASVTSLYFSVYVPLRVIEWTIIAVAIQRRSGSATLASPGVWLWIAGGILVSFASDMASPEGMEGRFCVGRCLC